MITFQQMSQILIALSGSLITFLLYAKMGAKPRSHGKREI